MFHLIDFSLAEKNSMGNYSSVFFFSVIDQADGHSDSDSDSEGALHGF